MTISFSPLRVKCNGPCMLELEAEDLGVSDFYELKEKLEEDDWTFRRVDRKYVHFCPDCGDPAG